VYSIDTTSGLGWQRLKGVAAILFVLGILSGLVVWHTEGWQVLSVQSGSMAPHIQTGDALLVRPVAEDDLRVGDVVSFYQPDGAAIVTHRVTGVEGAVITKGDANPAPDGELDPSLLIGRAERQAGGVGHLLDFARSPAGLAVLVYLPALWVVAGETRRLMDFFRPAYRHPLHMA
jgi:signal peptidase